MMVKENSQKCEVISLEQISKNKPINLGIVIDHSGSMMMDQSQLFDQNGNPLFYFDGYSLPVFPEGYTSPIDNAKSAVKTFVSTFNDKKDFISVIGFSSIVDKKLALTQNISKINSFVDSMQADYSTALYDAMISGIDEIKKADGVKVLVVLTDGQDNSSKSNWNEVIEKANKENIPIYIVGLGDVNTSTLSLITKSTQGQFYLVQSSSSLNKVYAEISKKVQAFYSLVYSSSNFSSADSSRQVELSFDIDSIYLLTSPSTQNFPAELIDFIAKKESEKRNVMYGGMVLAAILTSGTLLFYYQRRKRNKNKPYIKNIFPNPTDEILNIEYEGDATELHIINTSGMVAKTFEITGSETHFNLTDLQNGNYIAILQSEGVRSNQVKFILQR